MDYPSLGFAHGETIDMMRESIRHFAAAEIAPRAAAIDHDNLVFTRSAAAASSSAVAGAVTAKVLP